jgi:tRNA G10  N-methylase Trm11
VKPILAAYQWRSNAELIADVARLGYIKETDRVLDPTYGRGVWWKTFRPSRLHAHDLVRDGVDFRSLPYRDDLFDVVAFDPPYVAVGGKKTSTLGGPSASGEGSEFHDRYGLFDAPTSPAALQELINEGLTEMHRVTKARGYVLVKCQDYISSGRLWLGTHHTLTHGLSLGLSLVDRFEKLSAVRPQPPGRRQVHARRNLSTLFVFQKIEPRNSQTPLKKKD